MSKLNVAEIYAAKLNRQLIIEIHIVAGNVSQVLVRNDFEKAKAEAIEFWARDDNRFDPDVDNTQLWDTNDNILWSYLEYHLEQYEMELEEADIVVPSVAEDFMSRMFQGRIPATPEIDIDLLQMPEMPDDDEIEEEVIRPRRLRPTAMFSLPTEVEFAGRIPRRPRI